MRFKVFYRFFQQINSFSKETDSSVAKVTKKSSNLFSLVTMVYVETKALIRTIWNWIITTNKAFVLLFKNHFFELLRSYPVTALNSGISLVLGKFRFIGRILSELFEPFVVTLFTVTVSAAFFSRCFVKQLYWFGFGTRAAGLEFCIHMVGV